MYALRGRTETNVASVMAIYTNLPVYEETYQLLLQLVTFSRLMQRDFRYTIGEKLTAIYVHERERIGESLQYSCPIPRPSEKNAA